VEVSPALISNVTEAVMDEVHAWQSRPLDPLYPIVYLDALMVKMRDNGVVQNRAVYVALGVTREGRKEVLGLWSSANEGAKFWLQVLTELKNRGLQDIFIACVDGLKGFPQAIETVYPQTTVQLCIVHLVRGSLQYVNWKERRTVAQDLRAIYQAATAEAAAQEREFFAARWDQKYPTISALWKRHWEQITPLFAFPPEIRKIIYTTNAVESLHMTLRKVIKTRGSFPNEEAAMKLLYLALRNGSKKWGPLPNWKEALNRFALLWEARFPQQAL
jgi:putative transposase